MPLLAMRENVVRLLDRVASQMKSVRVSTLELYKASLAVYCPDYADADKTDETFQRTIIEMEKDIADELVKRDCDVLAVKRYLSGCYFQIVCGNTKFGLNLISTKRKARIAALMGEGETFDDAYRKSRNTETEDVGIVKPLVLRAPTRNEDASDYLRCVNEKVKEFLAEQGIVAVSGFRIGKHQCQAM